MGASANRAIWQNEVVPNAGVVLVIEQALAEMAGTLHPLEDVNVLKQRRARALPGDPRGMRADRVGWCGWWSGERGARLVGRSISAARASGSASEAAKTAVRQQQ